MSALRDDGMKRLARTVVSSRALIDADGTDAMAACGGGSGFVVVGTDAEGCGEAGAATAVLAVAVRAGDATFPIVEA